MLKQGHAEVGCGYGSAATHNASTMSGPVLEPVVLPVCYLGSRSLPEKQAISAG
jgi:hypothetical protein